MYYKSLPQITHQVIRVLIQENKNHIHLFSEKDARLNISLSRFLIQQTIKEIKSRPKTNPSNPLLYPYLVFLFLGLDSLGHLPIYL